MQLGVVSVLVGEVMEEGEGAEAGGGWGGVGGGYGVVECAWRSRFCADLLRFVEGVGVNSHTFDPKIRSDTGSHWRHSKQGDERFDYQLNKNKGATNVLVVMCEHSV